MGKAIGIDLGTTNSVMSIRVLKSDIIPNKEKETLTPSVVAYYTSSNLLGLNKKTEIIVGRKAHDHLLQEPENTISSVKRLMGRSFSDPTVQNLIQHSGLSYQVVPLSQGTSTSLGIRLKDGLEVTPQQVSGEILKKLKADAESFLNDEVTEVVITVPAYFNEKQKHATYRAAELAGFKVSRLLSEPSAAAIAYGIDENQDPKTILIYDFGGGTLDISILSFADGHFMEQAKGGDMWLGGDDIDLHLYKYITQKISEEFNINCFETFVNSLNHSDMLRLKGELKRASENAKIKLSQEISVLVEINSNVKTPNGLRLQFDLEISRANFEELITPIVKKSEQLVNEVINSVHFTTDLIDCVLMVGGSSAIPAFQKSLQHIFGSEKIEIHERPMHAIAEGAAILAKKLTGTDALTQKLGQVMYRSAHDYYLKLVNGEQLLLVEKQSVLPITTTKVLKYEHPSQLIGNFCFSSKFGEQFETIGELWLSHMPEELGCDPDKKAPEIDLQFTVTEDELVHVQVGLKDNPEISLSKTVSRGGEDEKLFNDLKSTINSYNEDLSKESNIENSTNKGFNFIYYSAAIAKHITDDISSKLNSFINDDERIEKISKIKNKLSLAIQLCEIDEDKREPIDNKITSTSGAWWNKLLKLEAMAKYTGDCFKDREKLNEYRRLVEQSRQALRDLESLEAVEAIFTKCDEFINIYAPDSHWALRQRCGGYGPSIVDSSYHSSVRVGLTQ
jgi:molecular chaperone DnaK